MSTITVTGAQKRYLRQLKRRASVDWSLVCIAPPASPSGEVMYFLDMDTDQLYDVIADGDVIAFVIDPHCRPTTPRFFVERQRLEDPPDDDDMPMLMAKLLSDFVLHLVELHDIYCDPTRLRAHRALFRI